MEQLRCPSRTIFGVTSLKLLGSRRPAGGFWILDFGFRIDNEAASLSVGNHLWGNFFEVIGKCYTFSEVRERMENAGLVNIRRIELDEETEIIEGVKI